MNFKQLNKSKLIMAASVGILIILIIADIFIYSVQKAAYPVNNLNPANLTPTPPGKEALGIPTKSQFSLNIRVDNMNEATFWNQYTLSSDHVHSYAPNISYLAKVKIPHKELTYGKIEETQTSISLAKSNGIEAVDFNREKTSDCNLLAQEEQQAYQQVHQAGLIFYFVPTGRMLQKCYQQYPQMIQNADAIMYQVEAIQGVDPNISQTVHTLINDLKQMRPGIPVWVQVSVNPPSNRNLDVQSVITLINSIEDGSAGSPDGVQIFASAESLDPTRFQTLEQVVKAYRTSHS